MSTDVAASRARCERLMAEALRPVAAELRLVELDELIFHVKSGRCAEMADIVASCAELHFRPGALEFALAAEARASWEGRAAVSIDLEFCAPPVTAFLRLTLGSHRGGVEVLGVNAPKNEDPAEALAAALARSRIAPDEAATARDKPGRP